MTMRETRLDLEMRARCRGPAAGGPGAGAPAAPAARGLRFFVRLDVIRLSRGVQNLHFILPSPHRLAAAAHTLPRWEPSMMREETTNESELELERCTLRSA